MEPSPISGLTTLASKDWPKPIMADTLPARERISPVASAVALPMMKPVGAMQAKSTMRDSHTGALAMTVSSNSSAHTTMPPTPLRSMKAGETESIAREFTSVAAKSPTAFTPKISEYAKGEKPHWS